MRAAPGSALAIAGAVVASGLTTALALRAFAAPYHCPAPPVADAWVQPQGSSARPAAYDSSRNAWVVVFSNRPWRLSLDPCGTWTQLPMRTSLPTGAPGWAQFDPMHGRVLALFTSASFAGRGLWELTMDDSASWRRIPTVGPLPVLGASFATCVFDPDSQRVIVHSNTDTTWILTVRDTVTSAFVRPTVRPSPRNGAALIWDSLRRRVLLHGGFATGGGAFSETWSLTLDPAPQWELLSTAGAAPATYSHWGVYDAPNDRVVFQGGLPLFAPAPRTWSLSLPGTPTWAVMPARGPFRNTQSSSLILPVLDRRSGRWLVPATNGVTGSARASAMGITLGDTLVWQALDAPDAPTWRRLPYGVETELEVFDTRRGRLIAFPFSGWTAQVLDLDGGTAWQTWSPSGGSGPMTPTQALHDEAGDRALLRRYPTGEVWALPLEPGGSWRPVPEVGPAPGGFDRYAAAVDPAGRRAMLVSVGDTVRLHVVSMADTMRWSAPVALTALGSRWGVATAFDTRRGRLLVFGGRNQGHFRDVWSVDPATGVCERLSPADSLRVLPRADASVVYDPVRDRMLVYGGEDSLGTSTNSMLAALELAPSPRWVMPTTHEADFEPTRPTEPPWPEPRNTPLLFMDVVRDRMVVHSSNYDGGDYVEALPDGWTLDWGHARPPVLACASVPPLGTDSMLVSWPVSNEMPVDAALAWTLTNSRGWPAQAGTLSVPALAGGAVDARVAAPDTAAPGPVEYTLVVAQLGAPALADTCAAAAAVVVDAPTATPIRFELRIAGPHPSPGMPSLRLTLPEAGPVSLESFDVAGRRMASERRTLPAGTHQLEPASPRLAPGVYAVRARWQGRERTLRVIVLE